MQTRCECVVTQQTGVSLRREWRNDDLQKGAAPTRPEFTAVASLPPQFVIFGKLRNGEVRHTVVNEFGWGSCGVENPRLPVPDREAPDRDRKKRPRRKVGGVVVFQAEGRDEDEEAGDEQECKEPAGGRPCREQDEQRHAGVEAGEDVDAVAARADNAVVEGRDEAEIAGGAFGGERGP